MCSSRSSRSPERKKKPSTNTTDVSMSVPTGGGSTSSGCSRGVFVLLSLIGPPRSGDRIRRARFRRRLPPSAPSAGLCPATMTLAAESGDDLTRPSEVRPVSRCAGTRGRHGRRRRRANWRRRMAEAGTSKTRCACRGRATRARTRRAALASVERDRRDRRGRVGGGEMRRSMRTGGPGRRQEMSMVAPSQADDVEPETAGDQGVESRA